MDRKLDEKGLRWYTLASGTQLPSVTTILHNFLPEPPALTAWKAQPKAEEKLKVANIIGTIVHYRIANIFTEKYRLLPIELELDDHPPVIDDHIIEAVRSAMAAFAKMTDEHKFEPYTIEHPTWHEEMMYAGTIDFLGDLDCVPTLIDFKTSPQVRDTHRAQVVAYKKAVLSHANPRFRPQQAAVVVVSPVNGWKIEIVEDEDAAWEMFWTAFDNFQKAHRPQERWCKK